MADSEVSDNASQSSYGTAGDNASVSESTDSRVQRDVQDRGDEGADLLEQNRNVEETVFACLYTLGLNRNGTDVRWTALRTVLEFLQLFRVVFNTRMAWNINQNVWAWKAIHWVLFRALVLPEGYVYFIAVFYVLAAVVITSVLLTVWVAVITRKDDRVSPWVKRLGELLQFVMLVVFSVFWAAMLDYLTFLFNCDWKNFNVEPGAVHKSFPEYSCIAMPHLAHMVFAFVVLVLFIFATICMSVCDCELNPLTRNHLASGVAVTNMKTMGLKIFMVILSTTCGQMGRTQTVLMLICAVWITYFLLTTVPYYHDVMNYVWVGLWFGIVATNALLVALEYTLEKHLADPLAYSARMTSYVLYGIWPSVLLGMVVCYYYVKLKRRPLKKFERAFEQRDYGIVLKDVHRFKDVTQAEFFIRVMRKWDEDGIPDPDSTAFGEFILKCALARFPNQPTLLILYSNLTFELGKGSQRSRTQVQMAVKNKPSLVERYFIYMSQEVVKRLKTDNQGMDLVGFVEFQRSYRFCVRAHKTALQAQRRLWHSVLRDNVSYKELQACFDLIDTTEKQAQAIYRRALERYPSNGKLLKVYGRFLEYVHNDPWKASRYYSDAMKIGTEESLLSLASASAEGEVMSTFQGAKANPELGVIDEKNDAIIIINSGGIMLMVNSAGARLFGYVKGELNGKNVAILMPQPFAGKHNSWVQRCALSGQGKILGSLRQVVGLRKDRSIFPLSLFIQRLTGDGADTIFIGIMRPTEFQTEVNVVRVWTTPGGIVLCASGNFKDWLGISSTEVVGRPVGTLCTDADGLDRFINNFLDMPKSSQSGGTTSTSTMRTQLLHKYLGPIDAEVSLEYGGSDDQPILISNMRCITDTLAVMVTDGRGRIEFTTSQMAAMVGYNVKTLTEGMNITMLMAPPYSQLHTSYLKDLNSKPTASSCRAGAVVNLMHAQNKKIPVTLQLSRHDDGERVQHVVKVMPATEAQMLDQQRLELQLSHNGRVLGFNTGARKEVFGFDPKELIGRPLASFINVFTEWRHKFGEDESLLAMLGVRAEQGFDVIYRVGVHAPYSDQELLDGELEAVSNSMVGKEKLTLLTALKARHKAKPAIMTLSMTHNAEEAAALANDKARLDSTVMLTMSLWRTEGLAAMVETDAQLGIIRAEPQAGLVFGVPHTSLVRKSFQSLAGLPPGTDANELLFGSGKKKSIVKQGGAGWKTGPLKVVECKHVDGGTMKMQVQAISKDGKTAKRLLVMSRLVDSDLGSLKPLLALRAAGSGDGHNASEMLVDQRYEGDSDAVPEGRRVRERKRSDSPDSVELHDRLDSRLRIEQWVDNNGYSRQGSKVLQDEQDSPSAVKQKGSLGRKPSLVRLGSLERRQSNSSLGEEPSAYVSVSMQPKLNKAMSDKGFQEATATIERAMSSASSDSQSASGNELQDAASDASGVDEELLVDWRRAKRLKKLKRMMTSTAAQLASARFHTRTYLVTLLLVAVHITCFSVILTQIDGRYQTTKRVGDVADGIQQNQMIAICANYILNCYDNEHKAMDVCSASYVQGTLSTMAYSYNEFRRIHHGLYLGYTALKGFKDNRLMKYWTDTRIPEYIWLPRKGTASEVVVLSNNTLWEMGNKYLLAEKDIMFNHAALKLELEKTTYFQYIMNNGPDSLFKGYSWTLDVYVDYAWQQFGSLNIVLMILLALEAVVQLAGMLYEFILLKGANSEAMKRCSVLLALPSATIRSVASRQLQVDDDDESDVDEDEMDAINAAAGATGNAAAPVEQPDAAGKPAEAKAKTVRMADPGTTDDSDGEAALNRSDSKLNRSGRKPKTKPVIGKRQKPKTLWQKLSMFVLGWADSTLKVNGKKLIPHNVKLWRFMVALLLWMSAVVIIYGVSYMRLANLQAPLASLNAVAHVRFRVARVRMLANMYAFAPTPDLIQSNRASLVTEIGLLRQEYDSLLYGGKINTIAQDLTFDANTPAAAFSNKEFSDIFFKTTDCLRSDKSLCYPQGSPWYDVTHSGLDAMVVRFIEQMTEFANVPDSLAQPNYTSYDFVTYVAAKDMYDGLQTAAHLFEDYMISKFQQVKTMHIILLACTVVFLLLYLWKLFRPYVAELRVQSKAMAGVLSQLPAEVDIEGHVKQLVLGWSKEAAAAGGTAKPGQLPAGILPPGAVPAAAPGAAGGWRNSLTNLLPGVANGAMVPAGAMMPAGMMPSGAFMMMPAQGGMPAMFFQPQQVKQDPEAASLDDENRTGSEDNI